MRKVLLDFVSFYLDMSSEDMLDENNVALSGAVEHNPPAVGDSTVDVAESSAQPRISPYSLSGTYIERTIAELSQRGVSQKPEIEVPADNAQIAHPETDSGIKAPESGELVVAVTTQVEETEANPALEADTAIIEVSEHSGTTISLQTSVK